MNFDRKILFDGLRGHFGKFNQTQVDVINAIVAEFERRNLRDVRWLAYMLATAKGECNFKPVREGFKKTDAEARKHVAMLKRKGVIRADYAKPHPLTGKSYYGRGCPTQITHFENYEKLGKILNLPLVNDPDLVLKVEVGVAVGFVGMERGLFAADKSGPHNLHRYFNNIADDPVGARRIINGRDKAKIFAGYHAQILAVLKAAVIVVKSAPPLPKMSPALVDIINVPASKRDAEIPMQKPAAELPQLDGGEVTAETAMQRAVLKIVVGLAAAVGLIVFLGSLWKGN